MNLKYSNNTVGCRIKDDIFIHPRLYEDAELYKAVLAHETEHTDGWSVKDVVLDLFNDDLKGHKKAYYKFMLKHPRTFLGLLPITKIGKYWAVDGTILGFTILAAGLAWFLIANII